MAKVRVGDPPYCDVVRGKIGKPRIDPTNSFFGDAKFGVAIYGNDGNYRKLANYGEGNFGHSKFGEDSLTP